MRLLAMIVGLVPLFASLASATALTYKLTANEKACFFTNVEKPDSKVAFYFAVRTCRLFPPASIPLAYFRCLERDSLQQSSGILIHPSTGPIWRLLRRRLHRNQPSRTTNPHWRKRTTRRLRLHSPEPRLLLLLLLQYHVHLRRQIRRL